MVRRLRNVGCISVHVAYEEPIESVTIMLADTFKFRYAIFPLLNPAVPI